MTFAALNPVPLRPYALSGYTVAATSATVTRAAFAAQEQLLSRDLIMVAPLANDMDGDAVSGTWGWFTGGWWRSIGDIPLNARIQESVLTLAWFYATSRPWNPYYKDASLARRLLAAIATYVTIQRSDGGFSEYSAVSTAAPTGFGIGHLALTWKLLEETPIELPTWPYWRSRLRACLLRAAGWALSPTQSEQWDHGAAYSNQLIASIAGCARIYDLLTPALQTQFSAAITRLPTVAQGSAGFLFEDSGPDFGYSTSVSVPYLAYLYQVTGRSECLTMAAGQYDFMAYNVLLEPGTTGSLLWNDAIATRTPLVWKSGTSSDEAGGGIDMGGPLRAGGNTVVNAFLTSASGKAAQRAAWAATSGAVAAIPATQLSPHRVHRATDTQDFPSDAEKSAALAALPCVASPFTAYKPGAASGTAAEHRYLYVKRAGYYLGASWGRYVTGTRIGLNFLYHPVTGTFICGQRNSEAYWGLVASGYSDAQGVISSSTTPPSDTSAFTLTLTAVGSTRSAAFANGSVTVTAARAGSFVERLPIIVWDTDTVTFELSGGGTQTATAADSSAASVTKVTILRPGLGTFTLTPSSAKSMTLYAEEATATKPTSTRTVRRLEIASTDTIGYTVEIAPGG